jgi:hypothetical protein
LLNRHNGFEAVGNCGIGAKKDEIVTAMIAICNNIGCDKVRARINNCNAVSQAIAAYLPLIAQAHSAAAAWLTGIHTAARCNRQMPASATETGFLIFFVKRVASGAYLSTIRIASLLLPYETC